MKLRTIAGALLTILAFSACGSATDAVTFKVPSGFKPDVSVGPFAQTWSGPNHSVMMFMAIPTKIDLTKRIENSPVSNAKVERDEPVTICGNQPARLGEMTGADVQVGSPAPSGGDQQQQIDFIATSVNGKTYMALYVRPQHLPADPAAEAALRNICPK
jgi:hypothetical protein